MVFPLPRYTSGLDIRRSRSLRRLWIQMTRFWTRSSATFRPAQTPGAAISIQELYDQSQRQAQREQLINHITNQTRQSLKLEIILSEAIAQLLDALNLDRCLSI
jgi:two-component system, NtrC family, sensor kinase